MEQTLKNKNILLIISGSIAAYKSLDLIRLLRKKGAHIRCILTKGGEQFVTPLSISALSEEKTYTNLWSLKDKTEMGHIQLSREADLIIISPASADLLAKMACGLANDLASTTLLAANKPILFAPAMNHHMWNNPATQENIRKLNKFGHIQIGPNKGDMACGETGIGRMAELEEIMNAIESFFFERPLKGYKTLITSGPTFEPIDPVRFIGNRSSGKQGYAIAKALASAGSEVTLITGPTSLKKLNGIKTIHIETAKEMLEACENELPADIAICAAAVCDWTPKTFEDHKIKKRKNDKGLQIQLTENPDILKTIATHKHRPNLVIGFAAETNDLIPNAQEKLTNKNCDWILTNDVSNDENVFGSDENHVYLITKSSVKDWGRSSKSDVANKLINKISEHLKKS